MGCAVCDAPDAEFPDPLEPSSATRGLCYDCHQEGERR
jgi:hypothetical protein